MHENSYFIGEFEKQKHGQRGFINFPNEGNYAFVYNGYLTKIYWNDKKAPKAWKPEAKPRGDLYQGIDSYE